MLLEADKEEQAARLREKLGTMKSAVADIDRWILEAAFKGYFSQDRVNDIYHRIAIIQQHMVDLEKEP